MKNSFHSKDDCLAFLESFPWLYKDMFDGFSTKCGAIHFYPFMCDDGEWVIYRRINKEVCWEDTQKKLSDIVFNLIFDIETCYEE